MTTDTRRQSWVKSNLIDRIDRVELRVSDVDRALGFYRDVAGLEVAVRDAQQAELRSDGGPVFLVLDSAGVTAPADATATGLFHTAFRFPTRSSLGDALARVGHAGLDVGAGDHLVSEALYVDDPDGNGVELYWDRPANQWPTPTRDAAVPMATLPVDLEGLYREGRGVEALDGTAPAGTDVGHVHLQVSDVDQTIDFYRDVVGLDLTARLGSSAGFFSSKGYHHNIGANSWRSRGSGSAPKTRAGLERVLFSVEDAAEGDALRARVRARGHDFNEDSGELVMLDPDGIELRFVLRRSATSEGKTDR
jgi:catechol 2,3-dioxygenase